MWFRMILLFVSSIISSKQYYFVIANPMVGQNIRSARRNEFPFVVGIARMFQGYADWENNFVCSGVLLTKKDVITAAHCVEEEVINEIVVLVGSHDLRQSMVYRPSWRVTYNEWAKFKKIKPEHKNNDIAHLRLSSNVSHDFNPPPLSTMKNEELFDRDIIIAAWGLDQFNKVTPDMKTATLTVLPIRDCRKRVKVLHGTIVKIHKRHICSYAVPPVIMSCGDSGGPLLHRGNIVGIHKATIPFPENPTHPQKLNIHTSIHFYRHFIEAVIDENFEWK